MAIIVDQKSSFKGEQKIRDAIEKFFSDRVVVYNNREVNGREYDICVLVEGVCVFIIEVKGWLQDKIKVNGIDDIEVEGYEERQTSPKKQAKSYCIQYLNKLKRKFGASPLVVDLVAYPYISKEEYYSSHLNIISEEQFTIFREDLLEKSTLQKKFQSAFDAKKMIPHKELSKEMMNKIRQEEEPNFEVDNHEEFIEAYSRLSIYPDSISNDQIKEMIFSYFKGEKQSIFTGNRQSVIDVLTILNETSRKENIELGNKLKIGFRKGIEHVSSLISYRAFNFEIYFVQDINNICTQNIIIKDGNYQEYLNILEWISKNSTFNFEQYKVEHASAENNILVEAGAGTGKTYSMVSRVAFLCNKKKNRISNIEEELAMVTFTNDAAINMKVRLKQMFVNYYILTANESYLQYVEGVDRANISTIHKFALELLRNASFYTGLGTNFKISADEYGRGQIYDFYLSKFLDEQEEQNENFISEVPVPIYDLKKKIIGIANLLLQKSINLSDIQPEEMGIPVDNTLPYFNDLINDVILPAELEYLEVRHSYNAIDLKESIILLKKILEYGAENILKLNLKYLFIDEFQDTDDVQIEVFQKLQKTIQGDCRLFVVGDLKQSIYRFRGARLSAFEQVKTCDKYHWEIFHLNINYRTDCRLLDLYDSIFSKMGHDGNLPYEESQDRLLSNVKFDVDDHELMQCVFCHGKNEEEFYKVLFDNLRVQYKKLESLIQEKSAEGKQLSREERTIAILVRNNWQVENIINEAQKREVNVEIKSGGDLFQLESTRDLYKIVLAMEHSTNPVYLVNFIESNYMDLKLDYLQFHGMSEQERVNEIQNILDQFFELKMKKTWKNIIEEVRTQPILYVLKNIYDALEPWRQYSMKEEKQEHYIANYEYLLEKIVKFDKVDTLTLDKIAKYLEVNILTRQQELSRSTEFDEMGIHILCTTVHKSKGLEYGTIILPYTSENISDMKKVKLDANYIKSKLSYSVLFENKVRERNSNYNESMEQTEQIAEECRILYVALTRAIRNCVWIHNIDKKVPISWGTLMEE